jgi:hypothetical protein
MLKIFRDKQLKKKIDKKKFRLKNMEGHSIFAD